MGCRAARRRRGGGGHAGGAAGGERETSLNTGNFTVMGWGPTREGGPQSTTLRKAPVPFVSDATCGQAYAELAPAICAGFTR